MISPALTTRIEPIEALAPQAEAWNRLIGEALEGNPFYAPAFLLAAARHLEKPGAIRVLSVWQGARMVGLFPLHKPDWREGMPFGVISAYWSPYVCLSLPLLAKDVAGEAWLAMLAALDTQFPGISALNFPILPLHRATARLIEQHLAARDRPRIVVSHYERATLDPLPGTTFGAYIAQETAEIRKSFRRRMARLDAIGAVEHAVYGAPSAERAAALNQFLELEASGWKGRHRTAMKSRPNTLAFMNEAFAQDSRLDYEIERLTVGGAPVAMCLNLVGGGVINTFKQAYDETYASYSPGKLLDRRAVARVIEAEGRLHYDSCALPGYPIEDIWHEREVVAHKLVGLGDPPCPRKLDILARRAMRIQKAIRRLKRWRRALMGSSAAKAPSEEDS
jgi:CelD/BcsL family acetyltransferase involved in cellulose biosynthesis